MAAAKSPAGVGRLSTLRSHTLLSVALTIGLGLGCQEVDDAEGGDAGLSGGAGGATGGSGGAGGMGGGATGEGGNPVGGSPVGGAPVGGAPVGGAPVGGGGEPVGGGPVGGMAGGGGAGGQPGGAGGGGGACPEPGELSVQLAEAGPIKRGDVATLQITAPEGATISGHALEGGVITPLPGELKYAPGDDLPWPWWTGAVEVEVEARVDGDCVGRVTAEITVLGDVLIADGRNGAIMAFGSDGRRLGRFAQGTENGAHDLIALPGEVGGGFVISGRGSDASSAQVTRLGADGVRITDFVMTDFEGAPLYDNMYHYGPYHLIWDASRGEILGDNVPYGRIHRWNLEGQYLGSLQLPEDGSDFNNRRVSVGFAVDSQGTVIAGRQGRSKLWRLPADGDPSIYLQVDHELEALANGEGDTILVHHVWGNDSFYATFNSAGGAVGEQVEYFNIYRRYIIPFIGGYLLNNGRSGAYVDYMSPELVFDDMRWQEWVGDDADLDTGAGLVWLHRP